MAAKPEQICGYEKSPGYKEELKKQMKRKRRRDGKALIEDAPKRNIYYGWST